MKYLIAMLLLGAWSASPPNNSTIHPTHNTSLSPTNWDSTKNWKIYKLSNFYRVFRIPEDSLQFLKCRPISDDSVHHILSGSKNIGQPNLSWMGCYLASFETMDRVVHKTIISHYGGFFYSAYENTYFEVSEDERQNWQDLLRDSYLKIETN